MPYSHYYRVGGPPKGYTQGIVDAVFRLGIGNRVWGVALREWGLGVALLRLAYMIQLDRSWASALRHMHCLVELEFLPHL